MKFRDLAERLVWTVVAAVTGSLSAVGLFDLTILQAAGVSGLVAGINFLSIVARSRLAVLPDPGAGLPGLPTENE